MKKITAGILAHVDAGKTTLTEDFLYLAGATRALGRVDAGSTVLDNDPLERERGITIFSKETSLDYKGLRLSLIDTPGHIDFAGEAERALSVMDYAILLISAPDGVTGHTELLFSMLKERSIPTFIFVNKTDQAGVSLAAVLADINARLGAECLPLSDKETISLLDDLALEEYLESGDLAANTLARLIHSCVLYPVFFGSALKNQRISELLDAFADLTIAPEYPGAFGARVFKISRDDKGNRLTHIKVTGGSLSVKDIVSGTDGEVPEKVDALRLYRGSRLESIPTAFAGDICIAMGLKTTFPGEGLGFETDDAELKTSPVLSYEIEFPEGTDPARYIPSLCAMNDEDPLLGISVSEGAGAVSIRLMGPVQAEILERRIKDRLGVAVTFSEGHILYKETISRPAEGVGHFEPLRHYAEVHLLMEPGERGSGISLGSDLSTDELALNWQRLIFTHLLERDFTGTACGFTLTDVRMTLVGGKAHLKHTEGGDFREATYRAVRQGLMEAGTDILEPYFRFSLQIPSDHTGKALSDLSAMGAAFDDPEMNPRTTVIKGRCPAATMISYAGKVRDYTKGSGSLSLEADGYEILKNPEEIIALAAYDPDRDTANPSGSVFTSHGGSDFIPWNEVKKHCHIPCIEDIDAYLSPNNAPSDSDPKLDTQQYAAAPEHRRDISGEEALAILQKASHANSGKGEKRRWHMRRQRPAPRTSGEYVYKEKKKAPPKERFLIVDGYNVIHASERLKDIFAESPDGARGLLNDILCNYQAIRDINVMVVYDAYRVPNQLGRRENYRNITLIFTAADETADRYIERFAHTKGSALDLTVATSDYLEQLITSGAGSKIISARELWNDIEQANESISDYLS